MEFQQKAETTWSSVLPGIEAAVVESTYDANPYGGNPFAQRSGSEESITNFHPPASLPPPPGSNSRVTSQNMSNASAPSSSQYEYASFEPEGEEDHMVGV